ncbi:MAG: DUF4368 domain-containing protein [Bacilli bacterium]|nr:DUF4368 domain-containing protein [Bacilli bacterium]
MSNLFYLLYKLLFICNHIITQKKQTFTFAQKFFIFFIHLEGKIKAINEQTASTSHFMELVQKYTRIDTLTHEVAREFIEKIIIHKAEKVDGHRQMKIDIFYNGIGKVDLPNEKA